MSTLYAFLQTENVVVFKIQALVQSCIWRTWDLCEGVTVLFTDKLTPYVSTLVIYLNYNWNTNSEGETNFNTIQNAFTEMSIKMAWRNLKINFEYGWKWTIIFKFWENKPI